MFRLQAHFVCEDYGEYVSNVVVRSMLLPLNSDKVEDVVVRQLSCID